MGLAKLYSRALNGTNAPEVIVEVHVSAGLPSFSIVGLPDTEVRESRDRVRSAIQMSGFDFPARRITVNLAPADLPKDSGRYDLAIALGILVASGLIKSNKPLEDYEFAGELALDGALRKTNGILAIVYSAKRSFRHFILPVDNAKEASLVNGINIYEANTLLEVIKYLCDDQPLAKIERLDRSNNPHPVNIDLSDVKGQVLVKFALEVAAAGRHSMLMIGNPGCGKSMLAERIVTILPPLTNDQALENASIYSLAYGYVDLEMWHKIPFRRPHHSSSSIALVGGGSNPKPGEISLAHQGVLFLDELPEFERRVLEMLREPLESKKINIARAKHKVEFPADFQLIAAMNPCPCGNLGHPKNLCKCSEEQIARYQSKISAPLLDRIDLIVPMATIAPSELENLPVGDNSDIVRSRVIEARKIQLNRQNKLNEQLNNSDINKYINLEVSAKNSVVELSEKFGLSARAYYRLLKVSRTVADLDGSIKVNMKHIAQSIQYRKLF